MRTDVRRTKRVHARRSNTDLGKECQAPRRPCEGALVEGPCCCCCCDDAAAADDDDGSPCWSTPAGIEGQNESSFRFDPMRWVETMVAEPERPCTPDMQVCVRVRLEEAFVSAVLLQNKRASLQRARRHGQPKCQDSRNPGLESLP